MLEEKIINVSMKVDVVGITRFLLNYYVEDLEGIIPEEKTYALNEYLSTQTGEDYEQLLLEYQKHLGVETVHVDDYVEFCEGLIKIIEEKNVFKELLIML